jgi:hypothetical protein
MVLGLGGYVGHPISQFIRWEAPGSPQIEGSAGCRVGAIKLQYGLSDSRRSAVASKMRD